MSAKHNDLVREIRLYLSKVGILSIDTPTPGLLFTKDGRPVKSTGKGKLDLHACAPIKRGGQTYGIFLAIDAKIGKDKLHNDQLNYARAVERHGGIAFAAYSVEDVKNILILKGVLNDDETLSCGG